jgi:hypothetical protein
MDENSVLVADPEGVVVPDERFSIFVDCDAETARDKWIESEKVGYDLGELAIRRWVKQHWHGFVRARWLEHLLGVRFWVELDNNDFGYLKRVFRNEPDLVESIVARLKAGFENLDFVIWATSCNVPREPLYHILEAININRARLRHQYDVDQCGS